jgi:hypothetical protein
VGIAERLLNHAIDIESQVDPFIALRQFTAHASSPLCTIFMWMALVVIAQLKMASEIGPS